MTKKITYQYTMTLDSPLGLILVQGNKSHIQYLKFVDDAEISCEKSLAADWFDDCRNQLQGYFSGQLKQFNLPLDANGTDFQKRVWKNLCDIKYGELSSYQQLARVVGNITAVRAVASANARNPIWLLIPCHRIIGSDRALRGYAGGIERKARLLQLEGQVLNASSSAMINEKTTII